MDKPTDIFSNVPRWLAILVGGAGFVIGFTQPLWVAIVYVVALAVVGVIYVKVQDSRNK
jgi:type IV secretory pathway TrbD component